MVACFYPKLAVKVVISSELFRIVVDQSVSGLYRHCVGEPPMPNVSLVSVVKSSAPGNDLSPKVTSIVIFSIWN